MALKNLKVNLQKELKFHVSSRRERNSFAPALSNDSVKREIGQRIVDAIIARTLKGKDKNKEGFKAYSKAYIKSKDFEIFGKTRRVNLKLTGGMQASIEVVKVTPNGFEIGFIDESEEAKATGHVKGANHLPVRDFWGLPEDKVMKKIMLDAIRDFRTDSGLDVLETLDFILNAPLDLEIGTQSPLLFDEVLFGT